MAEHHVAFMLQTAGQLFLIVGAFVSSMLFVLTFVRTVFTSLGGD